MCAWTPDQSKLTRVHSLPVIHGHIGVCHSGQTAVLYRQVPKNLPSSLEWIVQHWHQHQCLSPVSEYEALRAHCWRHRWAMGWTNLCTGQKISVVRATLWKSYCEFSIRKLMIAIALVQSASMCVYIVWEAHCRAEKWAVIRAFMLYDPCVNGQKCLLLDYMFFMNPLA